MCKSLISVVVPIYKVESYLERCVQSIVDQTYRNLEIILVDDGSPDQCPSMCDEWAKKDSRIKVIHKKNGGLSDARNAGMDVATGELMGFIDSDDWIEPDMYELLEKHMREDHADITACGFELIWEDKTKTQRGTKNDSRILTTGEAMQAVLEESWLKQPVWYKLYKTELIRDIHFPVGKYHEDVFWTYQAIGSAKTISVFPNVCYHYVQREGSIMGESFSLKRLDALEGQSNRIHYLEKYFPELVPMAKVRLWGLCLYMGQMSLKYMEKQDVPEAMERIQRVLHTFSIRKEEKRNMTTTQKVWWILTGISYPNTCKLRNFLKKGF